MGSHQVDYSEALALDNADVNAVGSIEFESGSSTQGNVDPARYPGSGSTDAFRESGVSEKAEFIKEEMELFYPNQGVAGAWDFDKILFLGMSLIPGFKFLGRHEMIRRAANAGSGGAKQAKQLKRQQERELRYQRYLAKQAKTDAEKEAKKQARIQEKLAAKRKVEEQTELKNRAIASEMRRGPPPPLYSHIPLDTPVAISFTGQGGAYATRGKHARILGWSADGTTFLYQLQRVSVELFGQVSEIIAIRILPKYPVVWLRVERVYPELQRVLVDPKFLASKNAEVIRDQFKPIVDQLKVVLSMPHETAQYELLLERLRSAQPTLDKHDSPFRGKLTNLAELIAEQLAHRPGMY